MHILLITSTIAPSQGVFALQRANILDRLNDYKLAFTEYCKLLKDGPYQKIVYVDNSGYNLRELKDIACHYGVESKVEFISYISTTPPNNSRFYLEINLIEHFLRTSVTLQKLPNSMVWKVTGRYRVKNISPIIKSSLDKPSVDIFINFRNYPYKVVDFYLIGFRPAAYKKLISENIEIYSGTRDGELILRKHLDSQTEKNTNISMLKRFPYPPRIVGIRGYDGGQYGGIKDFIKYNFRLVLNKLIPFVWV